MAEFGSSATNLSGGTIVLTLPPSAKWWFIQNQDAAPLKITFSETRLGPIILTAASIIGEAGDYLDSIGIPFRGASVTLFSTLDAHQFGCGFSQDQPTNMYTKLR